MNTTYTPEQQAVKDYFISERGYWRDWTEHLLLTNPLFLKRYAFYAGHPARSGPLTARQIELIYIALDASATHLFPSGLNTHISLAKQAGASQEDIIDVFQLLATQGIGHVFSALDLLKQCYKELPHSDYPLDLEQKITECHFVPTPWLKNLASIDAIYTEALIDLLNSVPTTNMGLTLIDRLLIEIALHACFTSYNPHMLKHYLYMARKNNIDYQHALQAIQLGAHLSIHGTALGINTYFSN